MNILHISTPATWRGGEQQVYYLHEQLQLHTNVSSYLLCLNGGAIHQKVEAQNWPSIGLPNLRPFNFLAAKKIEQQSQQLGIQLIHAHDAHAFNLCILATDFWGMKIPFVFSRRLDFPLKNNFFTSYKYNHKSLKKIICVSNKIAEIIAPRIKDENKISVVHDGIDMNRFKPNSNILTNQYPQAAGKFLIGNTSSLVAHKDYPTFLKTAKNLLVIHKNLHFFIIGEGKRKAELEQLANELGITKNLTFTGFRTDITEILAELDLFLMTSSEEGLGTSVLDAMATKVPVVSTNAGGLPESVIHGKTGLVANVGDIEQLTNCVSNLLTDEGLRALLVENAHKHIAENFTKQLMAKKTLAIYQQVLA